MEIPSSKDPRWRDVVLGVKAIQFEYLALRFFVGQAQVRLSKQSSEDAIQTEIDNLRKIFIEGGDHPKVVADFKKIFQ